VWKKIAPLLVALSVALNVAFISVWVVLEVRTHRVADATHNEEIWCPLHRRLNVTDEQWQRIEPRIAEFFRQVRAICAEINRLQSELIDLIAADEPHRQDIAAKQEEIRTVQQRMQQLVIEQLLAEKELLSPEQEKELFEMLRRRGACAWPCLKTGTSDAEPDVPAPQNKDFHQPGTQKGE
jgi:Spy/CpxP family protein refolding chaperone